MKSLSFQKILPHVLAIIAFYLLTLVYFYPEFSSDVSLQQSDMIHYKGMVQENSKYLAENGEPSMWNGRMFGGMPAYLTYPIFPYGAIPVFEDILRGGIPEQMAAHLLFLTMICTYIMLLCFQTRAFWSAVGGIVFALTTYNLILIEVGHITKLWAIAYAALILGGMKLAYRGKLFLGFALTALGMALEVKASHYQITYYFGFICLIFGISEFVHANRGKHSFAFFKQSLVLLIAFTLGVGVNAGKLLTTAEYSPYSTRGGTELTIDSQQSTSQSNEGLSKDYAFSWSQGIGETFTLLIPKLYGGGSYEKLSEGDVTYQTLKNSGQYSVQQLKEITVPFYHGSQLATAGPIYAGAIVCLLFVWGLFYMKDSEKWWVLAGVVLTMAFAWGKNLAFFNYFLFDTLPGFNKFRSVSMALSLSILLMVLLGFRTISSYLSNPEEDKETAKNENKNTDEDALKTLWIAGGITAGLCALAIAFSGSMDVSSLADAQFGQLAQDVQQDRLSMIRSSAFRSLVLIVLVVGAIYLYIKKTIPAIATLAIIAILAIGDVFLIGKDYLNFDSFLKSPQERAVAEQPIDTEILKDKDLGFRVMSLQNFQQESRTSYFHRSVGGYFAAKMQRYQDFMEKVLTSEQRYIIGNLQQGKRPDFDRTPGINMLNTRYITIGNKKEQLLENPKAYGTAWFVNKIIQVDDADNEIGALMGAGLNEKIDFKNTAILDRSKFKLDLSNQDKQGIETPVFASDSTASIKMTRYDSNVLEYESQNQNDGFGVFSEIYYPEGWTATIDGKETQIVRVNYILRGIQIPKGKHKIVFSFESDSYKTGAIITQISSWIVFLAVVISLGIAVWKEVREED